MRIAVIATRGFSDADRLAAELNRYRTKIGQLISGGARPVVVVAYHEATIRAD
jgi:hypothetical protein